MGHAENIEAKATRAVEIIEHILIPEAEFASLHAGLVWYRDNLYGADATLAAALWVGVGAGDAYFRDRRGVTRFDTSRPAIAVKLDQRIKATRPQRPVADVADPFADFESDASRSGSAIR